MFPTRNFEWLVIIALLIGWGNDKIEFRLFFCRQPSENHRVLGVSFEASNTLCPGLESVQATIPRKFNLSRLDLATKKPAKGCVWLKKLCVVKKAREIEPVEDIIVGASGSH